MHSTPEFDNYVEPAPSPIIVATASRQDTLDLCRKYLFCALDNRRFELSRVDIRVVICGLDLQVISLKSRLREAEDLCKQLQAEVDRLKGKGA